MHSTALKGPVLQHPEVGRDLVADLIADLVGSGDLAKRGEQGRRQELDEGGDGRQQ